MSPKTGILVAGGSAGGVEALVQLVAGLPADLPACVLVTLHIGSHAHSRLPQILSRKGPLPAEHAEDGGPLVAGRVLVAPPDRHLLVLDDGVHLSAGPQFNRQRPAVDAMFASAARWAGPAVVAVVLSGTLDDGAVGSALVARAGGHVLVQDPVDAAFSSMPRAAKAAVPGAHVAPAADLAVKASELLARVRGLRGNGKESGVSKHMSDGDDVGYLSADESRLTRLACPDCGGGLAEVEVGHVSYFRCHVGHKYSPYALEEAQRSNAEAKLWAAIAALEEHAAMARHLAARDATSNDHEHQLRVAEESANHARMLRTRLHGRPSHRGSGGTDADAL